MFVLNQPTQPTQPRFVTTQHKIDSVDSRQTANKTKCEENKKVCEMCILF